MNRNTAIGTHTSGNFPQCVVAGGLVLIAFDARRSCRSSRRTRCRSGVSRFADRCRGHRNLWAGYRSSNRHLRRCGGLRRIHRRIKQHGVFAQGTAGWPGHLDQEIQIGLAHRLARGHANHALTVGLDHRSKLEVGQEVLAINTGLAELLRRCQGGNHLTGSQIAHFHQCDLSVQRLVQCRLEVDFPQP